MADPVKGICDETGVSREEALFYLEGFEWDLDLAMDACRLLRLNQSSPEVLVNEKYASRKTPEKEPSQSNNQLIETLMGMGLSSQSRATQSNNKSRALHLETWNLLCFGDFLIPKKPGI
ncbi:unnamed protein product [Arabis nemorensis]|uniref:UBA domain-containing protein n=1 Tax=Arabis nemorensis TaxID=586526 RepID=A0A565C108_9BRAS|nr:unnamed protein product [Arabis nemorensis]